MNKTAAQSCGGEKMKQNLEKTLDKYFALKNEIDKHDLEKDLLHEARNNHNLMDLVRAMIALPVAPVAAFYALEPLAEMDVIN